MPFLAINRSGDFLSADSCTYLLPRAAVKMIDSAVKELPVRAHDEPENCDHVIKAIKHDVNTASMISGYRHLLYTNEQIGKRQPGHRPYMAGVKKLTQWIHANNSWMSKHWFVHNIAVPILNENNWVNDKHFTDSVYIARMAFAGKLAACHRDPKAVFELIAKVNQYIPQLIHDAGSTNNGSNRLNLMSKMPTIDQWEDAFMKNTVDLENVSEMPVSLLIPILAA